MQLTLKVERVLVEKAEIIRFETHHQVLANTPPQLLSQRTMLLDMVLEQEVEIKR